MATTSWVLGDGVDVGSRLQDSGLSLRASARANGAVAAPVWAVRVGGDDGELRPWHYIYVYSIESRLIRRVRTGACGLLLGVGGWGVGGCRL